RGFADPCLTTWRRRRDWCRGGDLNPYARKHGPLKTACLPVSPPRHFASSFAHSEGFPRIAGALARGQFSCPPGTGPSQVSLLSGCQLEVHGLEAAELVPNRDEDS